MRQTDASLNRSWATSRGHAACRVHGVSVCAASLEQQHARRERHQAENLERALAHAARRQKAERALAPYLCLRRQVHALCERYQAERRAAAASAAMAWGSARDVAAAGKNGAVWRRRRKGGVAARALLRGAERLKRSGAVPRGRPSAASTSLAENVLGVAASELLRCWRWPNIYQWRLAPVSGKGGIVWLL